MAAHTYVSQLVDVLAAAGDRTVLRRDGVGTTAADLLASIHRYARALDRMGVEDAGRDPQRGPLTEPERGADPGAEPEVRVLRGQRGEVGGGQVGDPHGRGALVELAETRGDHVGHQLLGLGEVVAAVQGEVDRDALDPDAVRSRDGLAQAARGETVTLHRGQPLEQDAGTAGCLAERGQVGQPTDRVDHPRVVGVLGAAALPRPPRREDDDVAVEPGGDVLDLGVRADREGVAAQAETGQPRRTPGQPADAEAVAVALGDRDQAGVRLGHPAEVVTPALAVDVQHQAHQPRLFR